MAGLEGYPGFLTDFIAGSTKDFVITLTDKTVTPHAAVDLTDAKFYLNIASDRDVLTNAGGDIEIEFDPLAPAATSGQAVGSISDSQTLALGVGNFFYSVRYVTSVANGEKTYVLDLGKIKGKPGVSSRVDQS